MFGVPMYHKNFMSSSFNTYSLEAMHIDASFLAIPSTDDRRMPIRQILPDAPGAQSILIPLKGASTTSLNAPRALIPAEDRISPISADVHSGFHHIASLSNFCEATIAIG